jgi:hypothetical protein
MWITRDRGSAIGLAQEEAAAALAPPDEPAEFADDDDDEESFEVDAELEVEDVESDFVSDFGVESDFVSVGAAFAFSLPFSAARESLR